MASPLDLFTAIPAAYGYEWDLPTPKTIVDTAARSAVPLYGTARSAQDIYNTLPVSMFENPNTPSSMAADLSGRVARGGLVAQNGMATNEGMIGRTIPQPVMVASETMSGGGVQAIPNVRGTTVADNAKPLPNQQILDAIKTVQGLKQGYDNLWERQNTQPLPSMQDTTTLPGRSEGIWQHPDGSYTNVPTQSGATFLPRYSGTTPSTSGWTPADVTDRYNRAMAAALNTMATLPNTETHAGNIAQAQKTLTALAGFNPLMKPQIVDTAAGHVSTSVPFSGEQVLVKDNVAPYIQAEGMKADAIKTRVEEAGKNQSNRLQQQLLNKTFNEYQEKLGKIDEDSMGMSDQNMKFSAKRNATRSYLQSLGVPPEVAEIPFSEADYLFQEATRYKAKGKKFTDVERKKASDFYWKIGKPRLDKEYSNAVSRFSQGQ